MSRRSAGPRLEWEQPKGYNFAQWFIRWYPAGAKNVRRVACGPSRGEAEKRFAAWLAERHELPDTPQTPSQMAVADMLAIYAEVHAPTTGDAERIGHDITALLPFWDGKAVSDIRDETCRAFHRWRRAQLAVKFPKRLEEKGDACFDGTIRRALETLRAAMFHCFKAGKLTAPVGFWLPEKPAPRDAWTGRGGIAKLVRAARSTTHLWQGKPVENASDDVAARRWYLPLFILISFYTCARKKAVLALQWQPNFTGGYVDLERGIVDFHPLSKTRTRKRRPLQRIHPRLLRILRYARARTTQYVIEAEPGVPVKNVKRSFATAVRATGMADFTPHALLHSAITFMMQSGVRVEDVAGFVNKTPDMIWRVYGKHHPDYQSKALAAYGPYPRESPRESPVAPRLEARDTGNDG